jgi:glycogen(starch) synthase
VNILIINTLYHPFKVGGAEVSVQLLAEGLAKVGHKVDVACLVSKHDIKSATMADVNGVTVHYLPLKNLYWPVDNKKQNPLKRLLWHLIDCYNPAMISQVKKLVAKVKPDVIHTNNLAGFSAGLLHCLSNTKIKLVHTARDYYFLHPNCTLMHGEKRINRSALSIKFWSAVRGFFLKKVDHFIGISQFMVDEYGHYYSWLPAKATVVYNPVKIDSKLLSQEKIHQSSDNVVFGFIGRLSPEKGFEDFCKLAQHCAVHNMAAKFVVAGKGDNSYLQRLKANYPEANIDFLGFVNSDFFYQSINVLVSPIKWPEPFGRTLVEANKFGIPFIGYGNGGASELHQLIQNNIGLCTDFDNLIEKVEQCLRKELIILFEKENDFDLERHSQAVFETYNIA